MSRKRPSQVWRVCIDGDRSIYVLARHAKGAKSVAEVHGYSVEQRHGRPCIHAAPPTLRDRCINAKAA